MHNSSAPHQRILSTPKTTSRTVRCFGWLGFLGSALVIFTALGGVGLAQTPTPDPLTITREGNVGIGTASPQGPIDIRDSSGRQIIWNMAQAGHTFVSANGGNAHLSGNLYFNGSSWNRINTANAGGMWWAGNDGTLGVLQIGPGSNPAGTL